MVRRLRGKMRAASRRLRGKMRREDITGKTPTTLATKIVETEEYMKELTGRAEEKQRHITKAGSQVLQSGRGGPIEKWREQRHMKKMQAKGGKDYERKWLHETKKVPRRSAHLGADIPPLYSVDVTGLQVDKLKPMLKRIRNNISKTNSKLAKMRSNLDVLKSIWNESGENSFQRAHAFSKYSKMVVDYRKIASQLTTEARTAVAVQSKLIEIGSVLGSQ